jgi:hypothetical protein
MFNDWSQPYSHLDPGEPQQNVLIVRFREGAELNERLSQDGVAQYDRVIQAEVMAIGQKNSKPIYEVERLRPDGTKRGDAHFQRRFARIYALWKEKQEPAVSGTPLEHWPMLGDMAMLRTLKDANIYTVEQLAEIGDHVHEAVRGPSRALQQKARIWLEEAQGAGGVARLAAENANLQEQVKALQAQMADLLRSQNTPGFDKPKRRGAGRAVEALMDDDEAAL